MNGAVTAPVQCCYVVPGTSTALSTTTEAVGGTIIRNKGGTQSVEERIISEKPQPSGNSINSIRDPSDHQHTNQVDNQGKGRKGKEVKEREVK